MLPSPSRSTTVVAVDLTADEGATSAHAALEFDGSWRLLPVGTSLDFDSQILELQGCFDLVALDGPRCPPQGFVRFVAKGETPPTQSARSRPCERLLSQNVCPIFYSSPVATSGVQRWMRRSWMLFEALNQEAIEVYPMGGFVSLLNGTDKRKPHGLAIKSSNEGCEQRIVILEALGLSVRSWLGQRQGSEKLHDRVDALMGAVAAACHVANNSVELGDESFGTIVLPGIRARRACAD